MILNLTQHPATPEQVAAGVFNAEDDRIKNALTFNTLPTPQEIETKALTLATLAQHHLYWHIIGKNEHLSPNEDDDTVLAMMVDMEVMIGGAPYLMPQLEKALRVANLTPVYAFSKRESVEVILDNGDVRKTNIFKHLGFV